MVLKSNLTLGNLFSGSGAFELSGALCGIEPVWNSEIEPFPIKVTDKRFPTTKQLGDVKKINGAEIEPVDIITAGFPCTDVSVAGKRKGLLGEDGSYTRSGLVYEAFRVIREMRVATDNEYPKILLFENVPGLLSSNKGEDFQSVMNELSRLGFVVDVGILDAQNFGVPQRRKRVFFTCVNIDHIMKNGKMIISESITLQLNLELLLNTLGVQLKVLQIEPRGLGVVVPSRTTNSLKRTMNTFSLTQENRLEQLQNILERITAKLEKEPENSESKVGSVQKENCWSINLDTQLLDFGMGSPLYTNMELSLNECWEDVLKKANECITSTAISEITQNQICTYFQTLLNTLKHIARYLSAVSQMRKDFHSYFYWVQSYLTEARGYIDAAIKRSKKHKQMGWNGDLRIFNEEIRAIENEIERFFREERPAEILPFGQSMFGDSAQSSEARERASADSERCVDVSGGSYDRSAKQETGRIGTIQ